MKTLFMPYITLLVVGIVVYLMLTSSSAGISNVSTSGCTCHGSTPSPSTVVTVTGDNTYYLNDSILFTITVSNPARVAGGFNLTCNIGTITTVGSGITKVSNTQLRHNAPRPFVNGAATWTFMWKAPATGSTNLQFNIAGNAVNLNGNNSGDLWNFGAVPAIPLGTTLNLSAFIQGYHSSGVLMQQVLANQGVSVPADQSDSVVVEIKNSTSPYATVASRKVLLSNSGNATVRLGALSGSRYITIKGRNHIETWSSTPLNFLPPLITYSFTTSASQAFGNNQTEVVPGLWAMYSGDVNQDMVIDIFDIITVEDDVFNFQSGYVSTDISGDGTVDIFDLLSVEVNAANFVGAITP